MTRANPNTSDTQTVLSQGPYTSPAVEPAIQPPTPLLDPREAKKPWPLNPFTNPYLWPRTKADNIPEVQRSESEWGQIDEEVEFPNRFTITANSLDPNLPKSLGCVTYDLPTSPSFPEHVGLFSTNPINSFPTTYKALAKLFLSHCKLQKHASVTIDATERQTLLASSPFVTLRRYASDIEKENEKLKAFAESNYSEALSEWEAKEQRKLRRKKSFKAAELSNSKDVKRNDQKDLSAQQRNEIEEAIISFKKQQQHRHLCIIATELLGRSVWIFDAYQLWDALICRNLITEQNVSEDDVKGIFLVWKQVPKEAVVKCQLIAEKEDTEKERVSSESNLKLRITKKNSVHKNVPQELDQSHDSSALNSTPKKSSRIRSSTHRQQLRSAPVQPGSGEPKLQKANSEITPSRSARKVVTPANSAKRKLSKSGTNAFAVADIISHGWGLWTKSGGTYFRHRKGRLYRQYLVRWAGTSFEDTWEPEPNLGNECLDYYWKSQGIRRPKAPPPGYDLTVF